MAVEVVVVLAVLSVAALLVDTRTSRETYAGPTDVVEHFDTGTASGDAEIDVTPGRLGLNQVRISLRTASGAPYRAAEVDAALDLPSRQIGPLALTVIGGGSGHYATRPAVVTFAGTWQLAVTIRSDTFDETTVYIPVPVS